jgi:hypothetical protein
MSAPRATVRLNCAPCLDQASSGALQEIGRGAPLDNANAVKYPKNCPLAVFAKSLKQAKPRRGIKKTGETPTSSHAKQRTSAVQRARI